MKNSEVKYSQITAMLAIARASFRSIIKNPSAIIFSIVFPLVFITVFGFIKGGSIKFDIGLDPASDTSSAIYKTFTGIPAIKLERELSLDEMKDRLQKGRLDAIVFFHPSDKNKMIAEVITSKASREKSMYVKSMLSNIIDKDNMAALESKYDSERPVLAELRESEVQGRQYQMIDFILPGQLGFSILGAGVFGTAFVFFSLRQTMVLKRFFATPIKRTYIVIGELISRLSFQVLGVMIILIAGKYIFGFTLINGFSTAIEMLLLSLFGLIVFMGFGFVISGLATSDSVIPLLANTVTLPQMLLSGTFFPIDVFPDWLQSISKALPLTHVNDALRKVAFEGAGFVDISHQLLIIGIWGIVIYIAAIRFFRWE